MFLFWHSKNSSKTFKLTCGPLWKKLFEYVPNFTHGSSPSGNSVRMEVSCQAGTGRKLLFLRGAEKPLLLLKLAEADGPLSYWIRPSGNWTPSLLFHLDSNPVFSKYPHLNESPVKLFSQENNATRGTVASVWQTDPYGVNTHFFSQADWLFFRWKQEEPKISTNKNCLTPL